MRRQLGAAFEISSCHSVIKPLPCGCPDSGGGLKFGRRRLFHQLPGHQLPASLDPALHNQCLPDYLEPEGTVLHLEQELPGDGGTEGDSAAGGL